MSTSIMKIKTNHRYERKHNNYRNYYVKIYECTFASLK